MAQLAGGTVRASDIPVPRYIKKAATESLTATTTMHPDADIAGIPLPAGRIYLVQLYLAAYGPAAADIKVNWTSTGGVTAASSRTCIGPAQSVSETIDTSVRISRHNLGTEVPYGLTPSPVSAITESQIVETVTAATAGTLTLNWAQVNSNATAIQVTVASYVLITPIEAG